MIKYRCMKKLLVISLLLVSISSCKTPEKLISQGNLNQAQVLCNQSTGAKRKNCLTQIGYAYLNKGEIKKAATFFDDANNLDGLSKVAEAFLKKNDYENYIKYAFYAQRQEQMIDDFTNNLYNWSLLSADNADLKLSKGKAVFSNSDNGYVKIISPSDFSFDLSKNFIIHTRFRRIDNTQNQSTSIVWGLDNLSTFCIYGISDYGNYVYSKPENNEWVYMISYTESNTISKGNTTNTLTILKSDNKVIFYINDIYVNEAAFDPSRGNKIGLLIESGVTVELLDYRLYTIPSFNDFCRQKAKEVLNDEQYDLAIWLLSKIGAKEQLLALAQSRFSNNDLYTCQIALDSMHISTSMKNILLGNFYNTNSDYKKASECYKHAGFSNTSDLVEIMLHEDFVDNRNNWVVGKNDYRDNKIENGNYFIQHFKDGYYYNSSEVLDLNKDLDFSVECVIKKIDGPNNNSMDVIWEYKDEKNYQTFGTSNQASFVVDKYENGSWITKINWTKSPYIITDDYNILSILKDSSTIQYFINGYWVCDYPFEANEGKKVGIGLSGKLTIAIDRLTVKQLAPVSIANHICQQQLNNNDYTKLAQYYMSRFEYLKTIEFAEKCNNRNLTLKSVPYAIQELLVNNRPNEALQLCEKYLDENTAKKSYMDIANYLISKKNYNKAEEMLKKAGQHKEAYLGLAKVNELMGDMEKSRKYTSLAGDLYYNEKQYEEALSYYQAADDIAGIEKIIMSYVNAKDFETAMDIAKSINDPKLENNIRIAEGKNNMAEKKYEDAIKIFQETGVIDLEKECYLKMGDEYWATKEYDKAEQYYELADAQTKLRELYQLIAYTYYKEKMYASAKEYYKKLGNNQKVTECESKIQRLPVKPGDWKGEHISFTVDDDGKNIPILYVSYPVRNSDRYSISMAYDVEIDENNQFSQSFGYYTGDFDIKGVFVSNTEAIVTVDGIYIGGTKGKQKIIVNWYEKEKEK